MLTDTKTQAVTFNPNQFLRMAQSDIELRKEIEDETGQLFREIKPQARKESLDTNTYQMLKILFNKYVMNYSNYKKKYLEA